MELQCLSTRSESLQLWYLWSRVLTQYKKKSPLKPKPKNTFVFLLKCHVFLFCRAKNLQKRTEEKKSNHP